MNKLERNKQNAIAFYDLSFNQSKPEEAIEKYAGDDYRQHNPYLEDGKEGFIRYFRKMAKEFPDKKVYFKRAIAEGNYVALHCYQEWPRDSSYASVDIFGFDTKGKIIEHWDVNQQIPDKTVNSNSMF